MSRFLAILSARCSYEQKTDKNLERICPSIRTVFISNYGQSNGEYELPALKKVAIERESSLFIRNLGAMLFR